MRKFLITTLFISGLFGLSLIYILNVFNLNPDINFQSKDSTNITVYFVYNENLQAVEFNVIEEEDVIIQTFSFLTTRKNNAPLRHVSKVPVNTRIINHSVSNNRLLIELTDNIFNTTYDNRNLAIKQITNTFLAKGYVDVFIMASEQFLNFN